MNEVHISEAERRERNEIRLDMIFSIKFRQAVITRHCRPLRKAMADADLLEIGRQTFILWKKFNAEEKNGSG